MKGAPLISMTDLAVASPRNPEVSVLTGVNWDIYSGDCWVITGLQGSGKTLLLETVAGLHPVQAGELRLFGTSFRETESPRVDVVRQRFGLVFDGNGRLFPNMTVWENITLPLRYHRNLQLDQAMEAVAGILQALEIESLALHRPGRLSRSSARRVALARALALRPDVLLLDNPLNGLDPAQVRWWRNLLQSFVTGHPLFDRKPLTLIITSDNLRPILPLGGSFALVHEGRWQILGNRHQVVASPDAFVQDLLDDED